MSTDRVLLGEKIYKVVQADGSAVTLNASHVNVDEHGNLRVWQAWKPKGGDAKYDVFNDLVAVWAAGQWKMTQPIGVP